MELKKSRSAVEIKLYERKDDEKSSSDSSCDASLSDLSKNEMLEPAAL